MELRSSKSTPGGEQVNARRNQVQIRCADAGECAAAGRRRRVCCRRQLKSGASLLLSRDAIRKKLRSVVKELFIRCTEIEVICFGEE
nr:hypothetical protein Iba_chr02aCG13890 [Ipomoea batatas]